MKKILSTFMLIFSLSLLLYGCYDDSVVPTYNMAKYTVNYYFEDVNGVYSSASKITKEFTERVGVSVTAEIKPFDFYTYKSSSSSVTGKVREDNSLMLHLYYTRNTYTIHFIDNVGGNMQLNSKFGKAITLPTLSSDTKDFVGWSLTGNADDLALFTTMPTYDMTLYAIWQNKE